MSLREEVDQIHDCLIVPIDFDFGQSCGVWVVPLTAGQLEEWWRSQQFIVAWSEEFHSEELAKIFNEPPEPPYNTKPIEYPGYFLYSEDLDDVDLVFKLWDDKHYKCHLCCDSDSFLVRPDGGTIYHAGYTGRDKDKGIG